MRIGLIGAGNVATVLGKALKAAGHQIPVIYNQTFTRAQKLAEILSSHPTADLAVVPPTCEAILIAVKDSAIPEVFHALRPYLKQQLVFHTAGSVPSDVFDDYPNCGVLWPVQTITAHFSPDTEIPLVVDGNSGHSIALLRELAGSISEKVYILNAQQRQVLHLCATIANNFSNHMYALASDLLKEQDISFDILKPIILETAARVQHVAPEKTQTGAARRGDLATIERHLALLADHPEIQALYRLVSESIRRKA